MLVAKRQHLAVILRAAKMIRSKRKTINLGEQIEKEHLKRVKLPHAL